MAVAYRAPLCVSCPSLMAPEAAPLSPPTVLSNRFFSCSRSLDGCGIRSIPSSHSSLLAGKRTRRRGAAASNFTSNVCCALPGAPEVITASSWNNAILQSDVPVLVEFRVIIMAWAMQNGSPCV